MGLMDIVPFVSPWQTATELVRFKLNGVGSVMVKA